MSSADAAEAADLARIATFHINRLLAEAVSLENSAPLNKKEEARLNLLRSALDQGTADGDVLQGWANVATDCSTKANKPGATDWVVSEGSKQTIVARTNAESAYDNLADHLNVEGLKCRVSSIDSSGKPTFGYSWFLPLAGMGCTTDAVAYYYQSGRTLTFGGNSQYLYNAEQSTSQISSDFMTATFQPGIQLVLAGTATVGSAQTPSSSSTTSTTPSATDSLSTTVAKLQQGGDFNLRMQYPVIYAGNSHVTEVATLLPNVGFLVNGLSSQNTITNVTNYSFNIPIETYGELHSLDLANEVPAVIYWDAKYGGEWISDQLAQTAGLGHFFGVGNLAFGVEFASSLRIGGQYFFGPRASYCAASASTAGNSSAGCAVPTTSDFKGFHFVISFNSTSSK